MSMDDKFKKLVHISFIIFLCCAMYDVWVGFDDRLMIIKLLLTTFFVILIGTPILSFIQSFKKENK